MSHGEYVSFTRIDLYESCPRAYACRYIERVPVTEKALAPTFGTVVHAALEHLIADAVRLAVVGPLSHEKAEHFYAEAWAASGLTGAGLFAEGLGMVLWFVQEEGICDPATILGVEVPFEIDVGGHVLLGRMDLLKRVDSETIEVRSQSSASATREHESSPRAA